MIAIDWIFIGGTSGIVGAALIERLGEEYSFGAAKWVGRIVKVALPIVALGVGLALCNAFMEVFLR